MAVYGATKAFVLSFTEALSAETRGTGVRVTALCPGSKDTGFFDVAGEDALVGTASPRSGWCSRHFVPLTAGLAPRLPAAWKAGC